MTANFYNIPDDMKHYRQFVCWKYQQREGSEKPTKVPCCPETHKYASIKDPTTWASFEQAVAAVQTRQYSGIGFVLTKNDPYTFIDLDDTSDPVLCASQQRIYQEFSSYSEVSPSGKGLHIIVEGYVPTGRRRNSVEVYSTDRYMTMTGNVYGYGKEIEPRQELLTQLWSSLANNTLIGYDYANYYSKPETDSDQMVFEKAINSSGGERFKALWNGNTSVLMGADRSASIADLSLVGMLLYHSKNAAQVERMWLRSPLGSRNKVQSRSKYRQQTITRAFENYHWYLEGGPNAAGE
jgi:primase-polymerase (primpol)-like protein